ncbi:MAG: hypothetical protein J6S36_03590 [Eggerthellaceae bacterium]|nr:hypothetical protein [Eggerthellaceae bacterium]
MARVLVAIPTFESIYPDTFKALWDMDRGGHDVDFEFVRGYDCATARNSIVRKALEGNYDHLMMVDNDVTVPGDALVNLMSHGVDVVMGYYAHRNKGNDATTKTNVCKRGELNYTMQFTGEELASKRDSGEYLTRVHGGGMGCILVRCSALKKMSYPYFKWTDYGNGTMLSEDLYFCEQCRMAGIKVYADTRVSCGHIFRTVQTVN